MTRMTPLPQLLNAYADEEAGQVAGCRRLQALLDASGRAAFDRHHFVPGHITASCWIVDATGDRCLLTHHRKLNRWLQLGGHCDGNPDVLAVCLREAGEESGLTGFTLLHDGIYDLDIHEIPARKADPAHLHYDVRFVLAAPATGELTVSAESHDLAWIALDRLPGYTGEESVLRLARKWELIRAAR